MTQDKQSAGQSSAICNCTLCLAPGDITHLQQNSAFLFCFFYHQIMFFPRSDTYSEVVPTDGPPSFRGQAVKYVYKLTIGCQRVNSPIKLLRVPFRVLVLHGRLHTCFFSPLCVCFSFQPRPCKQRFIFTRLHLRCINISPQLFYFYTQRNY